MTSYDKNKRVNFMQWIVASENQAITWTKITLSSVAPFINMV